MTTASVMGSVPESIRAGRNRSGSDIAKALLVKGDAANLPDAIAVTAADTDRAVGVTMEAIKNGYNGDIGRRGRYTLTASGAITAEARICPDAGGKVKAAVSGDMAIGHACETSVLDGDTIQCDIDCTNPALIA